MNRARISATLRPLAGAAVLGLGCLSAQAQTSQIDPSVAASDSIGASELQTISRFVSDWAPGLASDDMGQVAASRQRLSRPLAGSSVAVTFREAYAGVLIPELQTLLAGDNIGSRLAALRLAGELATESSAALILDYLDDDDEAVRYFAIGRMESVFEQASAHPPALSPETTLDMVRRLGDRVVSGSALEADAAVRALGGAMRLDQSGFDRARNEAATLLGSKAGERVRAMASAKVDESELIVALDACAAARSAVTASGWQPDRSATSELIGLGGDVLALVLERFHDKTLPETAQRTLDVQTARAAENLILFARRHHEFLRGGADSVPATGLGDLLESGQDRPFSLQAVALLGRDGELVRGFGFEANRFIER